MTFSTTTGASGGSMPVPSQCVQTVAPYAWLTIFMPSQTVHKGPSM